jgi:ESCRT-II complex subunit VPS22
LIKKKRKNSSQQISQDDIIQSINHIKILGNGFAIFKIKNKTFVQSVPYELNNDHTEILQIAEEKGFLKIEEIIQKLNWKEDRINQCLQLLLQEGISWIDKNEEGKFF